MPPIEGAVSVSEAAEAFESSGLLDAPGELPETTEQGAEPEESAEAAAEVETEEEAESTEAEDAGEETAADAQEQGAEIDSETLAKWLGVEADDLVITDQGIRLRAKVDGEVSEVDLAQLRKSYQLEGHLNKRSMEIAELRKAQEAQWQQTQTQLGQQIHYAAELTQTLEQRLAQEISAIDWNELRQSDPAEYAARRQEMQERQQEIATIKGNLSARVQAHQSELQQKQQSQMSEILQREGEALTAVIPEWKDAAKATAGRAELRSYLNGQGFNDEELGSVYDHRVVLLSRKAMLYDQMSKQADTAKKKVVSLPKLVKPGTATSRAESDTEARKQKLNRLARSGSIDDAAALFFDRM